MLSFPAVVSATTTIGVIHLGIKAGHHHNLACHLGMLNRYRPRLPKRRYPVIKTKMVERKKMFSKFQIFSRVALLSEAGVLF
jgi:hypothetical protein